MSVKKRIEELNSRFADKLSEKGVSADASDTTTELINKIDKIEVGIKVDPYVGDYVAEPTITDQKFPTKNLLMLDDFVVKKIPSEMLAKEEQTKILEITKNGSYEVKPDKNKVLSSVSLEVDVKDETLAEIETLIDESGVLDSTEGTVEEKVEQLIDKAEYEKILYDMSVAAHTKERWFENSTKFKKLPKLYMANTQSFFSFLRGSNVEDIDYYIDSSKVTEVMGMFANTKKLKHIVGIDISKATSGDGFFSNSAIEEIDEPINPIKMPSYGAMITFNACNNLRKIRFVPESVKWTMRYSSPVLTTESIQSIIDGLAYVETAQTLTLHKDITLTDEQKATIYSKGWTLAQ